MVDIGIIGTGYMAVAHLKALARIPNARVVAICNPSGRNLDGDFSSVTSKGGDAALRLDMSKVRAFRSVDEFLAEDSIQLVDVCAPTRTHLELGLSTLAAGKHLLIEKPVARNSEEALRMLKAAEAGSSFAMPAMCLRFWPEWRWLKRAIDDKTFGNVRDARFRRVAQAPGWGRSHFLDGQNSGGALVDLHIHDIDFVQYCFGSPHHVFASGYSKVSGAIDHVVAIYQVKGGATVSAEGSWAMTEGFGFNMSYTVNFEGATADYDSGRSQDTLRVYLPGQAPQSIKPDGEDGYVEELKYMVTCIESGRAPQVVTLADGVRDLHICEAEAESIRTGQLASVRIF